MPTFQKPNLEALAGGRLHDEWISIRKGGNSIGISRGARHALNAEVGDHLTFALDRRRRPWIGVVEAPTEQGEPKICKDGDTGHCINSTPLNRHLRNVIDGDAENQTIRFPLSGDTEEDPDTGATLHRLEVPEVLG